MSARPARVKRVGAPTAGFEPLADRLAQLFVAGASGVLTTTRRKLKRLFCLDRGWLIYATSNVIEEQFGARLVAEGHLTSADCEAAARVAEYQKRKLGALLAESKMIGIETLRATMERQVVELLSACLAWPEGELAFESGKPDLGEEITVRVAPAAAVFEHVRRQDADLDELRACVGKLDERLARPEAAAALLEPATLDDAARFLLAACDGERPVRDLLGESPAEEEPTLRALWAMKLVGALVPARKLAAAAAAQPLSERDAVLGELDRAEGADHYLVLGLTRGASDPQIREAYYDLARRLHPDRFRSGELQDLLPRIEVFFSMVTEAHNTLSVPERRKAYDDKLSGARRTDSTGEADTAFLAKQNFVRGRRLLERKRYTEALTFLENAAKLDPTRPEYFLALGMLLSRNARMRDEAEKQLQKVIELEPTSAQAYLALGDLYRRWQRKEDAARMYRETLRWDPENVHASARLGALGTGKREG